MSDTNKSYELRKLTSKDVFPMLRIIKKIGVNEFKQCFSESNVKDAINKMLLADAEKSAEKPHINLNALGLQIMLDIATIIVTHLDEAENEIYTFLAGISGMSIDELQALSIAEFAEMIFDVFQKEEFKDFISVVSKLLQ